MFGGGGGWLVFLCCSWALCSLPSEEYQEEVGYFSLFCLLCGGDGSSIKFWQILGVGTTSEK